MMSQRHGISRLDLSQNFTQKEQEKSRLLLQARWQRDLGHDDNAARLFADVAHIEEELSKEAISAGATDKFLVHAFSAASCWAQAGNFFRALALCEDLLARPALPEPLQERITQYAMILRERRANWYAEITRQTNVG